MKRDMDLCRKILLTIEADPEATSNGGGPLDIEGHDPTEVSYHVMLLDEAGLIEATDASDMDSLEWFPGRLTFEGHEFLESSRKESFWQKAKSTALEKTGGISLDVIKAVLLKLATDAVTGSGP